MELRHLRYFVAVAEELHFGRAAARLMIAQPPLSRQVRQLEDEVGVQLLERNRRGVSLTPAGAAFLTRAKRLLVGADGAAEEARRVGRGEAGVLRLGFVGSAISGRVLPALIRRLRREVPGVTLDLREMTTAAQARALLADELDCGFVRPPLPEGVGGLMTRRVERRPMVAALPADDPLAGRTRVRLADLAGRPWVTFPRQEGPGLWGQIRGAVREATGDAAWEPAVAQEATHMASLVGLVAAGLGCAVVPAEAQAFGSAGAAFRPLVRSKRHRPLVQDLAMAWAAGPMSPTRTLLGCVVRSAEAASQEVG